jgi:hypothetical protein
MLKFHRVNLRVCVAAVILDGLKYARAFAPPWLCRWMLTAKLSDAQSDPDFILHGLGGIEQIIFR